MGETSEDVQLRNDEDMWFQAELEEERSTLAAEKESSGEEPEEFVRSRVSSNEFAIVYSISTPPPSPASSSRDVIDPCQKSLSESTDIDSGSRPVSKSVQRKDGNASAFA